MTESYPSGTVDELVVNPTEAPEDRVTVSASTTGAMVRVRVGEAVGVWLTKDEAITLMHWLSEVTR